MKSIKYKLLISILALIGCNISLAQNFENILFTGRFDFSNSEKISFSHVSSSIKVNFSGTGIKATFSADYGISYLYIIVDGNDDPEDRFTLEINNSNQQEYELVSGLENTNHQIEIIKTNQWDTKVSFHGFDVINGNLLDKPEHPELFIEFYGDSNPAGHSAWDALDWGDAKDNGGYFTYPGITARLLDAAFHNISMGGSGVTPHAWRNLIDYHHLIHMEEPDSDYNIWDFSQNTADVVVINLGANDYYSVATKEDIKSGWKSFITDHLRNYYPNAHIVLANSYGWAFNEPTDYVHEAIEELNNSGDSNVSYVKFPWLWGQEHAVVNEHAGFANILATHIANKLNLPDPELSELSSLSTNIEITNPSFEYNVLFGVADGWRPHGSVTLIKNSKASYQGDYYLLLANQAWTNYALPLNPGQEITLKGWMRGMESGAKGKLKLEFKDQGQNTIETIEGLQTLTREWEQFSTTAIAPEGTWAVWAVLVAESGDEVCFDQITLEEGNHTDHFEKIISKIETMIYPNPANDILNIECIGLNNVVASLYCSDGCIAINEIRIPAKIDVSNIPKGIYFLKILHHNKSFFEKIIVN